MIFLNLVAVLINFSHLLHVVTELSRIFQKQKFVTKKEDYESNIQNTFLLKKKSTKKDGTVPVMVKVTLNGESIQFGSKVEDDYGYAIPEKIRNQVLGLEKGAKTLY